MDSDGADVVLRAVAQAVANIVTEGQINEVRGQLPEDMKHLFAP
jgi:uncharacterized protein (DUF2267 family)